MNAERKVAAIAAGCGLLFSLGLGISGMTLPSKVLGFLDVLFRTGMENNFEEYSNTELDALLDRAAAEGDREASLELYRRAEQLLVDDAACLPLWFGQNYILVKPHLEGYELNPMGYASLNKVRIVE